MALELDGYKVDVLHYLHPHLIWVQRKHAGSTLCFEQIGLYGVLPLETIIDEAEEELMTKKSSKWMPASSLVIKEALDVSTEVVFVPDFVDRKPTIFESKIHKYGEILIKKPTGNVLRLSETLIKSRQAIRDEIEFHQRLKSGHLNTKLNSTQKAQALEVMYSHYQKKESTSSQPTYNEEKKHKVRPITECNREKKKSNPLTEENLAKHNRYVTIAGDLDYEPFEEDIIDDIEEESVGRANPRRKKRYDSNTSDTQMSCSSSALQNKVELLRKCLKELPMIDKRPKIDISTRFSDEKFNSSSETDNLSVEKHNLSDKRLNLSDENHNLSDQRYHSSDEKDHARDEEYENSWNRSNDSVVSQKTVSESPSAILQRLVEMKRKQKKVIKYTEPTDNAKMQEEFTTEETSTEICVASPNTTTEDGILKNITNVQLVPQIQNTEPTSIAAATKKKAHKSGGKSDNKPPPYDPKTEMRVAFGPPEVDRKWLPLQVIPRQQLSNHIRNANHVPGEVIPKPEKEDFDGADPNLDYTINMAGNQVEKQQGSGDKSHTEDTHSRAEFQDVERTPKTPDVQNEPKTGSLLSKLTSLKRISTPRAEGSPGSDTSARDISFSDVATPEKKTEENTSKSISDVVTTQQEKEDTSKNKREDTSDQEEDDIAEILKKLEEEYGEDPVSISDVPVKGLETSDLKNYVNPFRNVEPDISVFVEKLVTPVIMVHSVMHKRFQPSLSISDVCFDTNIQQALKKLKIDKPMTIQSLTWFCVLRGYSVVMISPKGSGKSLGYLPAVCRTLSIDLSTLSDCVGPKAIVVCATAISVSEVEKLAGIFSKTKKVLALYSGMSHLEITTSLFNGCDLLVCTPSILFRLLKTSDFAIDLRRLATFVLDDCERLAQVYNAEVVYLQRKIKELLKNRLPKEFKVQYIVASREWHEFITPLAKSAPNCVVCIGAFQECVLYSKANTTASFVTKDNKDKLVLDFLQQIDRSKKTVIACRSDEEVERLEKVLTKAKYFVIACNSSMDVQELYKLSLTLNNHQDPVCGLILVCCDGNLTHLNMTDAHHLIHYSLPSLYSMFCKRFAVLNENYPSVFREENEDVKIKILLDDSNIEQLPKILQFIKRCTTSIPEDLDLICEKVRAEKDLAKAKAMVPICDNMLALGECPDLWNCRSRHAVIKEYDEPKKWMPTSGEITFKILHYHTATLYSARLITNVSNGQETKYPQTYSMLSTKISMYFATESNQRLHGLPQVGDICAVSVKQHFYVRCQVVTILSYYQRGNPNEVLIRLIDEEKLLKSRDIDLYYLPDEMKKIETHTIQVRLAGVKPKDKDVTFSSMASDNLRKITSDDDDLYVKGHIALAIGNCVFVDSLVTCKDLKFSNSVLRHDLKEELLNRFAKPNPEHMQKLESLCEAAQLTKPLKEEVKEIKEQDAETAMNKKTIQDIRWAHLDKDIISETVFTTAIDPGTFFVRLVKYEGLIFDLVKDIQKYVKENPEPPNSVSKGDIVLAKLPDDGVYERARVDDILQGNKIKCFFVDQGDWREVPITDLAPIPDKFVTRLPFQAIECRLFGVVPPGEGHWSDFSNIWLTNCFEVQDSNPKQLYVKSFTKETADYSGGHKYGVAVIDTYTDTDIVINKAMVNVNMARENREEMKMVEEMTFQTEDTNKSDSESNQDEDWEKVSKPDDSNKSSSECPKSNIPLEQLFSKKPIRSVPLVASDEESEDSDKWDYNINDDFKSLLNPMMVNETTSALKTKESDTDDSISIISSPSMKNVCSKAIEWPGSQSSSVVSIPLENSTNIHKEEVSTSSANLTSPLKAHVRNVSDVKSLDSDDLTSPEPTVLASEEINLSTDSTIELTPAPLLNQTNKAKELNTNQVTNPTKIEELRKPKLHWRQNKTKVHIKIQIIVEKYSLQIDERRLKFNAYCNDTNYGFDIELYGVIDRNQAIHSNKGQYILVTLTKILSKNWISLTKDLAIKKWIGYDVDWLEASSDEEEPESNTVTGFIDKNESETEDEDFVDDASF